MGVALMWPAILASRTRRARPGPVQPGRRLHVPDRRGSDGLNTAIVLSAATLRHGIMVAFRVNPALAVGGFVVALAYVRGPRTSAAHAAAPVAHHRVRA